MTDHDHSTCDAPPMATALMLAQRKIEKLEALAEGFADALHEAKRAAIIRPAHWKAMDDALAAYTAYQIDG